MGQLAYTVIIRIARDIKGQKHAQLSNFSPCTPDAPTLARLLVLHECQATHNYTRYFRIKTKGEAEKTPMHASQITSPAALGVDFDTASPPHFDSP